MAGDIGGHSGKRQSNGNAFNFAYEMDSAVGWIHLPVNFVTGFYAFWWQTDWWIRSYIKKKFVLWMAEVSSVMQKAIKATGRKN